MLQLIGFFFASLIVLQLLRLVPGIGGLFQIPFLGFLLTTVLVSAVFSKVAQEWLERRRERRAEAQFRGVPTPHNQGKLGSLLMARGRAKRALPHLERAHQGEPDHLEWRWQLGRAYAALGRHASARSMLLPALARDEGYAYGDLLLLAAECERKSGHPKGALELLERHERLCGAQPRSLWERGHALRAEGRRQEAAAAFREVGKLTRTQVKWKRDGDRWLELRSWLWRWVY